MIPPTVVNNACIFIYISKILNLRQYLDVVEQRCVKLQFVPVNIRNNL